MVIGQTVSITNRSNFDAVALDITKPRLAKVRALFYVVQHITKKD